VIENVLRTKVIEPDYRDSMVDGRLALARLYAFQDRHDSRRPQVVATRSYSGAGRSAAGGVHEAGGLADAGGGVFGAEVAGFVGGLRFAGEEPTKGGGRPGIDGSRQVDGGGVLASAEPSRRA
jgi:hypothetical protein